MQENNILFFYLVIRYCKICKIVMLNKEYYAFHMQVHAEGDRSIYRCHKCNKKFKLQKSRKKHTQKCINEDIFDFTCDFCEKKFKHKYDLIKHVQDHTGGFYMKQELLILNLIILLS